jgi:hypothetical protein
MYLAFQESGRRGSHEAHSQFSYAFILLREFDDLDLVFRQRFPVGTGGLHKRPFPAWGAWAILLSVFDEGWLNLLLGNIQERSGARSKFAADDKSQVMGDVVRAVVVAD